MTDDEIIRQKLEFLKMEYQKLREQIIHAEQYEWKIRQVSISLWLATVGVGIGLQGVNPNNFIILITGTLIPFAFLYLDALVGKWSRGNRSRFKEIEAFYIE